MRSGAKRTSYDGLHTVNASERNAPQATESDSHARLRVYKVRCAATLVPNLNVFITLSPLLYLPRTAAQRERLHFRAPRSAQLRPLPSHTIPRIPDEADELHSCLPSIGHAPLQQPPARHAWLLIIFLRLSRLRIGRTGVIAALEFIRSRSTNTSAKSMKYTGWTPTSFKLSTST